MVFSEAEKMSKRSKPLHNFSLPNLKWGNQKHLRCMKVNSKGEIVSSSDLRSSGSEGDFDYNSKDLKLGKQRSLNSLQKDGIHESRPKLKIHLHTTATTASTDKSKNKISIVSDENQEDESRVAIALRPWNLRTRRAACKEPMETVRNSSKLDEHRQSQQHDTNGGSPNQKSAKNHHPSPKSQRLRELAASAAANKRMVNGRREFSKSLSLDEIRYDFLLLTDNNNLPRRPKKRSKIVQRQLDNIMPGSFLTEVTTDKYRIPDELLETKKHMKSNGVEKQK
ncbi:hypothetical protein ACHQM5_009156 [Ranunculus cassubicifolius]